MANEVVQHSPAPGANLVLTLCGEEGIDFKGKRYTPDQTKGFFQFELSHAFPVLTVYGTGLHPNVIAKSFNSITNQNINYEHQIARYHEGDGRDVRDRVIGSIVAADFPPPPPGGWKVNPDVTASPCITGVGVLFKQTQGMAKVMGEHASSKHKYSVSMEVLYPLEQAGFVASLPRALSKQNGNRPAGMADPEQNYTPPDLLAAGYEYFPFDKAPETLVATFSRKKNRVVAQYKGRRCAVLMGGLDNPVHYAGVGVVHFPAEREAKIMRLAASADNGPMDKLADCLLSAFQTLTSRS